MLLNANVNPSTRFAKKAFKERLGKRNKVGRQRHWIGSSLRRDHYRSLGVGSGGQYEPHRRLAAGFCAWVTVLVSLWLPVMLPPYVTDRALAEGETAALLLPLFKQPGPIPGRIPYEYRFTVDGREYRGTEFLSEQAVRWDGEAESASAVVVYAQTNPAHHRMEPVSTIGGIRWVSVFPRVLLIAAGLSLTAWLAASWDHLVRLLWLKGAAVRPAADAAMVLLNTVAAVVFIVLPATAMAALLGWFEGNPFYVPHRGWLTAVAVLALAILLGTTWISRRVEAGEA